MAARKTPVREWEIKKAKGNRILARLIRYIMYTGPEQVPDPKTPEGAEPRYINAKEFMTDGQVRAALGVLKKFMPDLKSIELTGDPDRPVITRITRQIIAKPSDPDGGSVPAVADPE